MTTSGSTSKVKDLLPIEASIDVSLGKVKSLVSQWFTFSSENEINTSSSTSLIPSATPRAGLGSTSVNKPVHNKVLKKILGCSKNQSFKTQGSRPISSLRLKKDTIKNNTVKRDDSDDDGDIDEEESKCAVKKRQQFTSATFRETYLKKRRKVS